MYDVSNFTIDQVLALVQPHIKSEAKSSGEMAVYCPIRQDKTFDINIEKGCFKCFKGCAGCPVEGRGYAVQLYMLYNPSLSYLDACEAIEKSRIGNTASNYTVKAKAFKKVEEAPLASIQERDKTYREFLNSIPLIQKHKKNLIGRGLSEDEIGRLMFRSIPACGVRSIAKALVTKGCTLDGVPLFAKDSGGYRVCLPKNSGFFIPYFDKEGLIQQIQIRYDVKIDETMSENEVSELKQQRYRWATSAGYPNGSSAKNTALFWSRPLKDEKTIFITEGGLKASVASHLSGDLFVAIPGVSCIATFKDLLQVCKKNGIRLVEAFDMDGKLLPKEVEKGQEGNHITVESPSGENRIVKQSVKDAIAKMYNSAKEEGVEMIPWTWDPEYKGIDDYLYAQSKIGGVTHWVDDVKPVKPAHVMVPIMTPKKVEKDDDIQIPLPPVPKKEESVFKIINIPYGG